MVALVVALSGVFATANEVAFVFGAKEGTAVESMDGEARKAVENVEKRLKGVESSLEVVEARLGRAVQTPTLSHNIERRLQEVERRLTKIERDLKQLDSLARDVKRMEDRLRKLENRM